MATYKQSIKDQLQKEDESTQKAVATFLDISNTLKRRLNAAGKTGTFKEPEDVDRALSIYRNPAENIELRAAALLGLSNYAVNNEDFVMELIEQLKRPDIPTEIKDVALSVLQSNTFSSTIMEVMRPQYNEALRAVVQEDPSNELKLKATEYLAMEKDEFIQNKLLNDLKNNNESYVAPETAIQLLSYDLHTDAYETLKKIAADPPNPRAKREALRSLASDPTATDLLINTLNDKSEDSEIRQVCATGLQYLQPELFQNTAKHILVDNNEDTNLQVALLNTLNYTSNTEITDNDGNFQRELEKRARSSKSKKLKDTYKFYLNNKTRNNF